MTYREYYDEARIEYDADEETTEDTITVSDAAISEKAWAKFIGDARREVAEVAVRLKPTWLTRKHTFIWPSQGAHALSTLLPQPALSLVQVEQRFSGAWHNLPERPAADREKYELIGASFAQAHLLDGEELEVVPGNVTGRIFRITYFPEPSRISRADLTKDQQDVELPRAVHFAVPIVAARNAARRDNASRPGIEANWSRAQERMAELAAIHNQSSARYPRMTRPNRRGFPC